MTGEQRLTAACLIQGILDKDDGWIDDDRDDYPYAFVSCCRRLGLTPRRVRQAIGSGKGIIHLLESWGRSQGQRTNDGQLGKRIIRRR